MKRELTTDHGYKVLFLPRSPMAHSNGYVYVHRLVMARKLGRILKPEEQVHHKDEDKTNNHPDNLELVSDAEHKARHRKSGKRRRNPGEPNPMVICECGCRRWFPLFDKYGRPRRFITGHNESKPPVAQSAVLRALSEGPMKTTDLLAVCKCSATVLSNLRKAGLIENRRYGVWAKTQR